MKKKIQKRGGGGQGPPPPEVVTGVRENAHLVNFENLTPRKSDLAPNEDTCCPGCDLISDLEVHSSVIWSAPQAKTGPASRVGQGSFRAHLVHMVTKHKFGIETGDIHIF